MSVATEITRLTTAKANIKTAIESKGVTVPAATKLDGYGDLVASIPTGTVDPGKWNGWTDEGGCRVWINVKPNDVAYQTPMTFTLVSGNGIGSVSWGDGTVESINSDNLSHVYSTAGYFKISFSINAGKWLRINATSNDIEIYAIEGNAGTGSTNCTNKCLKRFKFNSPSVPSAYGGVTINQCPCVFDFSYNGVVLSRFQSLSNLLYEVNEPNASVSNTYQATSGQDFMGLAFVRKVEINSMPFLTPWMFKGCSKLTHLSCNSITKVWPDEGSSYTDRHPLIGCAALQHVYVLNKTCAETMAMGVFPWGYAGTTAIWHCSDGTIEHDGTSYVPVND